MSVTGSLERPRSARARSLAPSSRPSRPRRPGRAGRRPDGSWCTRGMGARDVARLACLRSLRTGSRCRALPGRPVGVLHPALPCVGCGIRPQSCVSRQRCVVSGGGLRLQTRYRSSHGTNTPTRLNDEHPLTLARGCSHHCTCRADSAFGSVFLVTAHECLHPGGGQPCELVDLCEGQASGPHTVDGTESRFGGACQFDVGSFDAI